MKDWFKMNTEALFDYMRYKLYELAFKYYTRKARSHPEYAFRANNSLDIMDSIVSKWENYSIKW